MTVAELKQKLETFPPDMEVVGFDEEVKDSFEIVCVDVSSINKILEKEGEDRWERGVVKTAYKVTEKLGSDKWGSCVVGRRDIRYCQYTLHQWTNANKWSMGLFCFEVLRDAVRFRERYNDLGLDILKCEVMGERREMLGYERWPEGTVTYRAVKPIEVVSDEQVSGLQNLATDLTAPICCYCELRAISAQSRRICGPSSKEARDMSIMKGDCTECVHMKVLQTDPPQLMCRQFDCSCSRARGRHGLCANGEGFVERESVNM